MPDNISKEYLVTFRISDTPAEVAQVIYNHLSDRLKNGVKNFILPGGRTPHKLYELISKDEEFISKAKLFLTDERLVPHDSDKSNYGNIVASFPVLRDVLYSWYDHREFFPKVLLREDYIAVLGVGEDGHFASLFPEDAAFSASGATHVFKKDDESWERFSLGYQFFLEAREVILFVTGSSKSIVLEYLQKKDTSKPVVIFLTNYSRQVYCYCDKSVIEAYEH